jgi:CDGSH-type Zn-finger protein
MPETVWFGGCRIKLEVGKDYYYCACGLSKNQPFCDGSHKGTKFGPLKFTASKEDNHLCQCRRSANLPYCDGTHQKLDF